MHFADFAQSHGLLIRDMSPSHRIRRCPTDEHPRSRNGAYLWDGQRGWVMRWDGDGQIHWHSDEAAPTKIDWLARAKSYFAIEQERDYRASLAASIAQDLIKTAEQKHHSYLQYKGLDCLGFVTPDDALVVPMRDVTDPRKLLGVQIIRWLPKERKYEKKMLSGMRAKGAVFRIGRAHAPLNVLCEGYVTGLSIEAALLFMRLPATVWVCFSASNLEHVAPLIQGRKVVFADNDFSGVGEQVAKRTGLPYCMSPEVGEDANDLHYRAGLVAVAQQLMQIL